MEEENLFVYGTLRKETDSEIHHLLTRYADFVGKGTYQGRLYKIDNYPGVIPSGDPTDQVHGEVFCLREPEILLSRLDQYEECGPGFPEPSEYVRKKQEVRLKNGRKLTAWIYIYNRPVKGLQWIASGDFLKTA
jgi:gamma-glutamylcyclotransferase (GGCT)/AIG2-like uncharacterized protein YtfP